MAELSAERRERILQAMAQSVVEEGIQGASLRKVAKRANATTGMITHYYRSKNELIVEALRSAGSRYRASLATSGVKPGIAYGESDDIGATVAKDRVHVHDFHATILHLLGIDHEKLTYRHASRDFRLTDVAGEVVRKILL